MTARIALLMVAAVALAACESTKAVDTSPSKPAAVQTTMMSPSQPTVVRSPLVPDDNDGVAVASYTPPKVHRPRRPASDTADTSTTTSVADASEPVAPVSKPVKPAKPSKPSKPDTAATDTPVTTADASTPPPATPADTAPAPTDTAPDDTATPTTDTTAVADGTDTKSMFSDPSAFMQAQIGGFPVWLVALVGVVLLAALLIGMGGSRKKSDEVV